MKTIRYVPVLLLFAALSSTRLGAALESLKFDPDDFMPSYPVTLLADGVTRGQAIIAVSVDADGKLADTLVLGYTKPALARSCLEALKAWRFTPAKLDGVAVASQVELTFDFALHGAVISTNILNHFFYDHFDHLGDGQFLYRIHGQSEIDRAPVRINTVMPKYATAAEKQGVRGRVSVRFYIDERGEVRMPAVSAGPDLNPYLIDAAVAALREWRFEPVTSHGRPVLVAASQEFNFSAGN